MTVKIAICAVLAAGAVVSGAAGCGDDDGGGGAKDAGPQAAVDAGRDASSSASVTCGTATCTVTEADQVWGAEACCVDAEKSACGVKADMPVVPAPDGGTLPVGQAIAQLASLAGGDAGIVTLTPTIACLPKNAAGARSAACPTEIFRLDGMAADAGSEDAGPGATYEVPGCCRPDGMCGYLDENTGLGCVKISQSLVGQVLGREDQSCN